MKKIYIFIFLSFLWQINLAQNTVNSQVPESSAEILSGNVAVHFFIGVFGDSVVHMVWENHDQNNIKKIVLESSNDGINFTQCSEALISTLTDIHSNNYPQWIDYNNHILMSTESGNVRYIYNDVVKNGNINLHPKWYHLKMLTFSGNTYISQEVSTKVSEQKDNNTIETGGNNSVLRGKGRSGCPSVETPPSGYVSTGETQTYYGQCCYWVETRYEATGPVLTSCSGDSYAWCCHDIPDAANCSSGWVSDPCCVHLCSQYSSCSCVPWGIYVKDGNNGCCTTSSVSQWVVTESVEYTPPTATVSSNSPVCVGATLTLTGGPGSMTSYSWSGPNSYTSGSQSPTVSASATTAMAGNYTITVTNSNGCTGTAQTTVTVNSDPAATASSNSPLCSGQTLNLTSGGGTGYSWSGPNGFTSSTQNPSIAGVTPAASGTYTVTVTAASGCTLTAQTTVTVNTNPVTASSNGPLCSGQTLNLTSGGGTGYSWSGPNSFASSTQNPSIAGATPAASGTYTVTVTTTDGCISTAQTTVAVISNPIATASSNSPLCAGQTLNLTSDGGTSYSWSGPNGFTSSAQNPSIAGATPAVSGAYTVTVTATGGCTSTAQTTVTVNSNPIATASSNSPLCAGQTLNLTSGGGTGYSWSGPNSFTSSTQNPSIAGAIPAASGVYIVTVTATGDCISTAQTTVTVNSNPIATASSNSPLCAGQTLNLTSGGGTDYSWNGPNSFTSSTQNPSIAGATPAASGTYIVTISDANGCSGTDDIVITVNSIPPANAGIDQIICAGQSAILNASGGYTYAWSPATGLSNANIANPMATPASTTTYTVTVSDMSGCTGTDAAAVIVNPVPTFTYTADSVLCYSGSSGAINILVSGGTTPYTYAWTPNVSTDSIANNIPAGTYQIAISDINGCDTVTTITIGEPPQLTLSTSGNVTICNDQSTTISATATGGVGSYTFTWDNGLGIGSSFSVDPTTTTTYIVSVTDGNACSVTNSLTVMISPPIFVNVIANPVSVCYGGTAVLTATLSGGNGNYIYTWGQGIGMSTQSITVMPVTTTMYPVTVTDNCGSPQGADSVEVIVYPLPTVQFTSDTLSGCEPLVVIFADSSAPVISTWLWDFGDIQSGSDNYSTKQNPIHTYINAGTYTVTLTVTTTNGCIGSYTRQNMIIVFPSPDASFSMHPKVGSTQNPKITFIDLSTNASTWSWNFGEIPSSNNTSDDQNPQHSYESAGIFTVMLVVESPYGCLDSTSNEIWIKQDFAIFFPNAFTPNGDSKNDGFRPEGDGVDLNNYQLYIYDRYGELIFKTNDFYEYWNGKVMRSDKMAEVAVYSWVAFVKDTYGRSYTFNGRVTLIK